MKNAKLLFLSLLVLPLCSCNIFGDLNSKNESSDDTINGIAYVSKIGETNEHSGEYASKDINYYKDADELITVCQNINTKRMFYKAYRGYCAVGLANIEEKFGPVLVGEDPVQVCYKSTKNDDIIGYAGSFELNNKTFYYSSTEHFVEGKLKGDRGYENYFSSFTTLEEVAKDIAEKATFVSVSEDLKNKFQYKELVTGNYSISAGPYAAMGDNLVLPAKYNNIDIIEVEKNGFSGLKNIKTLEFEDKSHYKSIGDYAFNGCTSLSYAVLPSTLTSIGYAAFDGCSSSLLVFAGFDSWDKPSRWFSGYQSRLFYGCAGYVVSGDFTFGIDLDGKAFVARYRGDGGDVEIPDAVSGKPVVGIGKYAFDGCAMLRSVALPSTLKWIRDCAFRGCARLAKVEIPEGATSIGDYAFNGCTSLSYAVLPSTLTSIGYAAFDGCSSSLLVFAGFDSWDKPSRWFSGYQSRLFYKGQWHYSDNGTPTPNE